MALAHVVTESFEIRKRCVGSWENNAYVIIDRATGASVIVDAADEADTLIALAAGTDVAAVVTTHGHFDHVGAARAVCDHFGVPFRLHHADASLAGMAPDVPLEPGPLHVGSLEIEVAHTPGHTRGSVSLLLPGAVLTGDTLFPGGPGATRFEGSSFPQIVESIGNRLFTLDDETLVLPGHGLDTTIGTERPHLQEWIDRGW